MGVQRIESIKESLDDLFNIFYKIVDYDEIELGNFLTIKDSKNFNTLIITKYMSFLFVLGTIILMAPIVWLVIAIFGNINIGYLLVIISIPSLLYIFTDILIIRRFNYNFGLYRKEKHDMGDFLNQLYIVLSNHKVESEMIEKSKYNDYEKEFKEIQKRVIRFTNAFKPYMYYFEHFGLISIISIIISFFLGFILTNFSNTLSEDLRILVVIETLSYICVILAILLFFSLMGDQTKLMLYSERKILLTNKNKFKIKIESFLKFLKNIEFKEDSSEEETVPLKELYAVSKVSLILKLVIVIILMLFYVVLFYLSRLFIN